ncbi:hypothetical protein ASG01_05345 [Chryseobacterium sp. Leaf180]|uniref:hypothetical protein n=1 Tax=Chryseobacterium sp. Leaf180 TaxID=1736289 RepID=UPI0007001F96|nr:hypothetical protein [Chryseobacterium sp. Leaf180]KQR95272.1 hypothetical protein ASG01_05345 [Chryseobacterium sp. Leaf180]
MQKFICLIAFNLFISCKPDEVKSYDSFIVDKNLHQNDTLKILSKLPELRLYKKELIENKTRSAYILQTSGALGISAKFENYKCSAICKNDTLNIILNNSNGYFGNGILIKVFDGKYFIRDYDPKTLRDEEKFLPSKTVDQKLILNKSEFTENDSLYGSIYYRTLIENHIEKTMRGYFRTTIQ